MIIYEDCEHAERWNGIKGLLLNVEIDESDKSVEAHNGWMKGF